jgi:hypothetical protein
MESVMNQTLNSVCNLDFSRRGFDKLVMGHGLADCDRNTDCNSHTSTDIHTFWNVFNLIIYKETWPHSPQDHVPLQVYQNLSLKNPGYRPGIWSSLTLKIMYIYIINTGQIYYQIVNDSCFITSKEGSTLNYNHFGMSST